MNHYDTLGVSKNATPEEIKKAFRKLAMKHHPDRGGDDSTFKKINEAYDVLGDEKKRHEYDNPHQYNNHEFHFTSGDGPFADIFGDVFNQFRQNRQQPQRNPDAVADLNIDIETAYYGKDIVVDVGFAREIISVPKGARSGTKIRIPGKGHSRFRELPAGDLIVRLNVISTPDIGISGSDIYQKVSINALEAITGTTIQLKHINGKVLSVKVPAGSQDGSKLRLSNYGMPIPNSTTTFGSLFVIIEIYIPQVNNQTHIDMLNSINKELKNK